MMLILIMLKWQVRASSVVTSSVLVKSWLPAKVSRYSPISNHWPHLRQLWPFVHKFPFQRVTYIVGLDPYKMVHDRVHTLSLWTVLVSIGWISYFTKITHPSPPPFFKLRITFIWWYWQNQGMVNSKWNNFCISPEGEHLLTLKYIPFCNISVSKWFWGIKVHHWILL